MPKRVRVEYMCQVCGAIYGSEDENKALERASNCEKKPVEKAICKRGDAVLFDGDSVLIRGALKFHSKNVVINAITVEKSKSEYGIHKLRYHFFSGGMNRHANKEKIRINK